MLKKYFALIITSVFMISMFSSTAIAADSSRIKVYMNEGELYFNTSPILKNDRTFVEMRPIFEQAQKNFLGIKTLKPLQEKKRIRRLS
jgi:hypothetical protein